LERHRQTVLVSIRFLTHLYECALGTPMYNPVPVRKHYEEIFLKVFRKVAYERGEVVKVTSGRPDLTAIRAMRRNSGIRMVDSAGHVTARLKSEYRGAPVRDKHVWDEAFEREFSVNDIFGVFEIQREGAEMVPQIISAIEESGLICEFDPTILSELALVRKPKG
jgi:hypothetical protein